MRFIYRNIDQFASLESNILQPVCAALPPYFRKFIITPAVVKARDGDICKLRNWELRYNLGLSASSMSCFLRALFESMSQQTNGLVSLSLQYVVQFLLFRNELKIAELFHSSNYQRNLWDCFLGEQRNPLDPEPLCLNWAPKNGILNADGNRKFQNLNSVALDFKTCVKWIVYSYATQRRIPEWINNDVIPKRILLNALLYDVCLILLMIWKKNFMKRESCKFQIIIILAVCKLQNES